MYKKYSLEEKIGVSIILIVAIFLFTRMRSEENRLKSQGVYVVGKLVKSFFGGADNGWMYEYEYFFNSNKYTRSFSGPIKYKDSLLFFKVLPANPKISRQVLDFRVPKCSQNFDFKKEYWKELPICMD